jgi:hypothetical protein
LKFKTEETKWEAKKTLVRWDKTKPTKNGNYELDRVGPGSRKLESINRGAKNSYRVINPHDNNDGVNRNFIIYLVKI